MNTKSKIGWSAVAVAIAALSITQFLAAQVVGPPVFTPQMTVSPGFLTVTTGPTSVQNLTINGTCTGCVGAANFANPTGTIGLTAVNGSAVTGIRSDGAPALSQAIAPTWTSSHVFANTTTNLALNNSGAALNAKNTLLRINNGGVGFAVGSATDAAPLTAVENILQANRSGLTWSGLILGNATDNPPLSVLGQTTFSSAAGGGSSAPVYISNTSPAWSINETDGAVDNKRWDFIASAEQLLFRLVNDANSATTSWLAIDRTGTTVDTINLQATSVQKNSVEIATYETGSFTVNYGNACTTTPSQTWDYIKIGNQVTLKLDATSGFPCTGDTTAFSSGAVPAALIPPDNAISPVFGDGGCQDNGTVVSCAMSISGGLGLMSQADCTGGGACNATGWQAAGNRQGFALGVTFTYSLDP